VSTTQHQPAFPGSPSLSQFGQAEAIGFGNPISFSPLNLEGYGHNFDWIYNNAPFIEPNGGSRSDHMSSQEQSSHSVRSFAFGRSCTDGSQQTSPDGALFEPMITEEFSISAQRHADLIAMLQVGIKIG